MSMLDIQTSGWQQVIQSGQTAVMAVLNVTPDSFSDGGTYDSVQAVVDTAGEALASGAHIIDVGGESTRPGAVEVPVEEELDRVIPVIGALHRTFPEAAISIDTRKAAVARQAVATGAAIINDVSGLRFDPAMVQTAAETGAFLVIMHSIGTPETMQQNLESAYPGGVLEAVRAFFETQIQQAVGAGLSREKIILDPGFGFGKTLTHNLELLSRLGEFQSFGLPLLAGTSRKSFLTLGNPEIVPGNRDTLTAASVMTAIRNGASLVRAHNVATLMPVIRFADALKA